MTAIWPAYDEYQAKTTRDIPLVILERKHAVRMQRFGDSAGEPDLFHPRRQLEDWAAAIAFS